MPLTDNTKASYDKTISAAETHAEELLTHENPNARALGRLLVTGTMRNVMGWLVGEMDRETDPYVILSSFTSYLASIATSLSATMLSAAGGDEAVTQSTVAMSRDVLKRASTLPGNSDNEIGGAGFRDGEQVGRLSVGTLKSPPKSLIRALFDLVRADHKNAGKANEAALSRFYAAILDPVAEFIEEEEARGTDKVDVMGAFLTGMTLAQATVLLWGSPGPVLNEEQIASVRAALTDTVNTVEGILRETSRDNYNKLRDKPSSKAMVEGMADKPGYEYLRTH